MSNIQLATYIRSRRKNIGLTQKELAEKVYVSTNTVARWERSESEPSWSDFLRVCAVLGMKMEDFVEKENIDE